MTEQLIWNSFLSINKLAVYLAAVQTPNPKFVYCRRTTTLVKLSRNVQCSSKVLLYDTDTCWPCLNLDKQHGLRYTIHRI